MTPAKYDMKIGRGCNYKITLTASNDVGPINFSTTYTGARIHVRPAWVKHQRDIVGDPLYIMDTANGIIVLNNQIITIEMNSVQTRELPFNTGSYTLELYKTATVEIADPFTYGFISVGFEGT